VLWGGYLQAHPEYSATVHAALMEMYRREQFRPVVGATYPFEQAPRGLRDLANRKVMGKSVLTIGN
jgi:NADPH2:quinone reductase